MFWYAVRIEIPDDEMPFDYQPMHVDLWDAGFRKKITADDGSVHTLPDGTYVGHHAQSLTAEQVRNLAYRIARQHHSKPRVIAFRWDEAAWQGLLPG